MQCIQNVVIKNEKLINIATSILNCGALGDSIGAPLEHLSKKQIFKKYGNLWKTDLLPGNGTCTDDTEIALFTCEGLILSLKKYGRLDNLEHIELYVLGISESLQRWLIQRGEFSEIKTNDEGFIKLKPSRSAEIADCGQTTLRELSLRQSLNELAINDSRGNGSLARAAPVAIFSATQFNFDEIEQVKLAYNMASSVSRLTHGSVEAISAAGTLAALITLLINGRSIKDSIKLLKKTFELDEVIRDVLDMCLSEAYSANQVLQFEQGWTAAEALKIAILLVMNHAELNEVLIGATFHDGDSDSIASIAGQLWGSINGAMPLPSNNCSSEHTELIAYLAEQLCTD
jgi:ADP-ribosylglycohydrolase